MPSASCSTSACCSRRSARCAAPPAGAPVEPALAAGATIVIGYGLAGRLLPGLIDLAHSRSAGGRLEQPITYWNAEGALAAVGLVLCARMAGDRTRPPAVRTLAAAATAPLGAGMYLSFSRGAIAAGVLGLVVLVALAPDARAAARRRDRARHRRARRRVAARRSRRRVAVRRPRTRARRRDRARAARAARGAPPRSPRCAAGRARRPAARRAVAAPGGRCGARGRRRRPRRGRAARGPSRGRARRRRQRQSPDPRSSNRYEYWRVGLRAFGDHPLAASAPAASGSSG